MNGDFNEFTLKFCLLLIEHGAHSKMEMTLACVTDRVPIRLVHELLCRGCTLDEVFWQSVVCCAYRKTRLTSAYTILFVDQLGGSSDGEPGSLHSCCTFTQYYRGTLL